MIKRESVLKAADNAGAISFKCITIFKGFNRRYARLGELVGVVAHSLKSYRHTSDKMKLVKLAKKVKKKRKIKNPKKRKPNARPYLALLVALKSKTRRSDGSSIKFDENRVFSFVEPVRFGPAGKTQNIPGFIGTKAYGPCVMELVRNAIIRERFKSVLDISGGIA